VVSDILIDGYLTPASRPVVRLSLMAERTWYCRAAHLMMVGKHRDTERQEIERDRDKIYL
jgi:hypothetical protein